MPKMVKCGAVVLAGGGSRRVGVADKAFMLLGGKPLIKYVVERALEVVGEVRVVIEKSGSPAEYRRLLPEEVQVRCDEVSGKGPIAGFVSGMKGLDAEYVTVLACDAPFVNPAVLKYLFKRAEEGGGDLAIPQWPNGYIEPLQAVYRTASTLRAANDALAKDEHRIMALIQRLKRVLYVPVDELKECDPSLLTFFNVNTAEDLERAQRLLEESKTINGGQPSSRSPRPPWC